MTDRIVIDPNIHPNKPVIRGTRIPIARILGSLAGGMTLEDVIQEYEITQEDILATLDYLSLNLQEKR